MTRPVRDLLLSPRILADALTPAGWALPARTADETTQRSPSGAPARSSMQTGGNR